MTGLEILAVSAGGAIVTFIVALRVLRRKARKAGQQ